MKVEPYDAYASAAAIREMAQDAGSRAKLGSAAHETAESFTVDRTAERYLAMARELLGGSSYNGRN